MRANNYNSKVIRDAQAAFVACKCSACERKAGEPVTEQCQAEAKLWAELDRGEDMYIAALNEYGNARSNKLRNVKRWG